MSAYTHTDRVVAVWRKILRAKLELRDAIAQLEEIIGIEFDVSAALDQYLAAYPLRYCKPDDADAANSEELESFFDPETYQT